MEGVVGPGDEVAGALDAVDASGGGGELDEDFFGLRGMGLDGEGELGGFVEGVVEC